MVLRLMAAACASLTMRAARSDSDHCAVGMPLSAGFSVARMTTRWRSSGGKSPWGTRTRQVFQTIEAVLGQAAAPLGNGIGIAGEFDGDLPIGWIIRRGASQDDAASKDLGLGRRCGVADTLKLLGFIRRKG